jgi:hypothetical protein
MKTRLSIFIFVVITCSFFHQLEAQQKYGPNDTITFYATYLNDSTLIPTGILPDAVCIGHMPRWMREKIKAWTRLRNAVYVTYPYALQAGKIINEINASLVGVTNDGVRRRLIKEREKDLKKNFGDKITNLSVYQGKVLMKLINRQTGSDCYEILKEYKGGVNARFWQTVAFFFGSSLKQSYDGRAADAEIESIVREVELLYRG